MSTTVPSPLAPETSIPHLSEGERIINTFVAPSKTFADIRHNQSWWVPWLIVSLMMIVGSYVLTQRVDMREAIKDSVENSPRASQFDRMSPEQKEQVFDQYAQYGKVAGYVVSILLIVYYCAIAGILLVLFNFGFGQRLTFKQTMAITAYSFLPWLVSSLFLLLVLFVMDPDKFNLQNPMATNIAFLIETSGPPSYLIRLLRRIDLFSIWIIFLMATGIRQNTKLKTGTAFATIFATWFIAFALWSILA